MEKYLHNLLCASIEVKELAQTQIDWDRFKVSLASDKKASRDTIRLVLPAKAEGLQIVEIPRNEMEYAVLQECMFDVLISVGK